MILPKPTNKKGRHKQTIACDITPEVRKRVEERDGGVCVICKCNRGLPNMHYIARSQGGLGIEQNIATGCPECHHLYDNGNMRETYGAIIKSYLMAHYPNWNEEELIYNKHR